MKAIHKAMVGAAMAILPHAANAQPYAVADVLRMEQQLIAIEETVCANIAQQSATPLSRLPITRHDGQFLLDGMYVAVSCFTSGFTPRYGGDLLEIDIAARTEDQGAYDLGTLGDNVRPRGERELFFQHGVRLPGAIRAGGANTRVFPMDSTDTLGLEKHVMTLLSRAASGNVLPLR